MVRCVVFEADQHELSPECWVSSPRWSDWRADGRTLETGGRPGELGAKCAFRVFGNERESEPTHGAYSVRGIL